MQLNLYYEDKDILVCFKPAGVATQTSRMADRDMVSLVKNYLVQKGSPRDPYLGVIHRLDQPVSGLLVFAKNKRAAAALSHQLGKEAAHKEYLALCWGRPLQEEGALVHYLKKDKAAKRAVVTSEQDKEGKRAELIYQVEGLEAKCQSSSTLLRIRLKTGRFHQIRAQLSAIGHPLLGDRKYGNEESEQKAGEQGITSVALCACSLGFKHPFTGEQMEFTLKREDLPLWDKRQG